LEYTLFEEDYFKWQFSGLLHPKRIIYESVINFPQHEVNYSPETSEQIIVLHEVIIWENIIQVTLALTDRKLIRIIYLFYVNL
jgi:hypothetical protein